MTNEIRTYKSNNKIIREKEIEVVKYNPATDENPKKVTTTIKQEKILKIHFHNGSDIEECILRNLAETRGGITKEQLFNKHLLNGHGHIIILQPDNTQRSIRVSNIITSETVWENIEE